MNRRQRARQCTLDQMASWDNLLVAAGKARAGKSRRPDVENWWMRRETELRTIRASLLDGSYTPGPYHQFPIVIPKRRIIAAAPFGDRVVHHALCTLIGPILERRFIQRSFSCQKGKGTTAARACCRQLTNRRRYVLKCDIAKFFPNIDHELLLGLLRRHISCPGLTRVIQTIVSSFRTGAEPPQPLFPGDDWLEVQSRPRGLPIGNLTSQLWANLYLDPLDHWITEEIGHGDYLRYTDDFLLFSDDKERLWQLFDQIQRRLALSRLKLARPKSRVLTTNEGVPFCGFVFRRGLRPRVLGATKRRFEARRGVLLRRGDFRALGASVFAWYQFSREGNSLGLRRAYGRKRSTMNGP